MTGPATVAMVRLDQVDFHPHNVRRDLGDLRALSQSLDAYGCVSPISVERWGERLRLRAGHRRVAAARLAGITRLPAVVHRDALELREWIEASVQENVMRAGIDDQERTRAVRRLRELDASWSEVAGIFGVSVATAQRYGAGVEDPDPRAPVAPTADATSTTAAPARTSTPPSGATPPSAPRAPRSPRVAAVYLVELVDRWADAAPRDFLDELRALAETGRVPEQPTPSRETTRSTR